MPFKFIDPAVNQADAAIIEMLAIQKNISQTIDSATANTLRSQLEAAINTYNSHSQQLQIIYGEIVDTLNQLAQAKEEGKGTEILSLEAALNNFWQAWQNTLSAQKTALQAAHDQKKQLADGLGTAAAFSHLDSQTPIVLLPVRLETRYFASDAEHYELRVRIFPDDIHLDSHQPMITSTEYELTRGYWDSRLDEGVESDAAILRWQELCQEAGDSRAMWLAGKLDPFGKGGRFEPGQSRQTTGDFPTLPIVPDGWTVPAKARGLPDRWAIVGYRGNKRILLHWTNPVPPELQVSPEMGIPGTELSEQTDELALDEGIKWITDFAEAEAVGMAARIQVPKILARAMDKLVVFGVCASQLKEESAHSLEKLFSAHSAAGLDFLELNIPTNNTEEQKTEYREQKSEHRQSHDILLTSGVSDNQDDNANLTANALGIDKGLFRYARRSQSPGEGYHRTFHRALWSSTMGSFFEDRLDIQVSEDAIAFIQSLFINHVRSNGLLPSVRVGSQPYGLLPVTALTQWKPKDLSKDRTVFHNLLLSLHKYWNNYLIKGYRACPRLFDSLTPQKDLVDLLGMTSYAYIWGFGKTWDFISPSEHQVQLQQWWQSLVSALQQGEINLKEKLDEAGSLTYQYLTNDGKYNLLNFFENSFNSNTYISTQEDKSLPLADNYIAMFANHPPEDGLEPIINHQLADPDERPIVYYLLKQAYLKIFNNHPESLAAFQDDLKSLQTLSVEHLENLFIGFLGDCFYRLDPWISSLANQRLAEIRDMNPQGVYIGGFGWLEGLEPPGEGLPAGSTVFDDLKSAGYIHMPSLSQSKTAAIVHGGYLSHVAQGTGNSLDINLTSRRVKLARWLLDGIRQGQQLGALLGYRFERHLIQNQLGQYIPELRQLAPLSVGQAGTNDTDLAAANVVDGLSLHRQWLHNQLPISNELYELIRFALYELNDGLDALSDLLVAEGVHHATSGNAMRAGAAFDAIADGTAIVDEPEVIATPVSGHQVGHRVMVILPADVSSSWPGDENRLRAKADPYLNSWAASVLGSPQQIRFQAAFTPEEQGSTSIQKDYSLAEFNLCPLDVVYLSAASVQAAPLVKLLQYYLKLQGIEGESFTGDVMIHVQRTTELPPDSRSLEEIIGLAYSLLKVFNDSRPLQSTDLQESTLYTHEQLDEVAVSNLANRASITQADFSQLKTAFTANPTDATNWWQVSLLLNPVDPALPDSITGIIGGFEQRQATYNSITEENPAKRAIAQINALLGQEFQVLPPIQPANSTALTAAFADQNTLLDGDLTKPKNWLQDYGRVRSAIESLDLFLTTAELFDQPSALQVAQLPLVPQQPWIGEKYPATGKSARLSLVAHRPFPVSFDQSVTGLLMDSWSEIIPNQTQVTGLAFHYDEPKAQAPQAVLVAVPPDLVKGWEFEALEAAIIETLDLAKTRAIEIGQIFPGEIGFTNFYFPTLYLVDDIFN